MAAVTKENLLLLILAIPSICTGLSYETLKGDSNGNDIVSFSFSEKVFDQCAKKCNENRDCVGFTYAKPTPSPGVQNCNLKSVVHYPPTSPSDVSQRTGYMLPSSNCLIPVVYSESAWLTSMPGYGYARNCFNAGYCWGFGSCYECAACYTLDKPWLYNVARNKSAVQSSTALSLGASYAVDGNTDGGLYLGGGHIDTCTHTERNDQHPWWTVDLGKTYEIHSIVLFNRRGTVESGRLQKFEIRLGSSYQKQTNPLCWRQDSPVIAGTKTFKCQAGPAVGRHLSVEKFGTGLQIHQYILTLCEVVVIGALPRIENAPKLHSILDTMTVKWDKYQYGRDADISKYRLLYRLKGTGTVRSIDVSRALTEYTLTGLSRGTEYNISVIVIMADGTEGLPSPYILNRTVPCGSPPSPDWHTDAITTRISYNAAYPSIAQITVRWKLPTAEYPKCNQVANYIIQYWNNTRAMAVNITASASSTSHTIPGLRPYTKYFVAILVHDTNGNITNMPDEKSIRTSTGRPGPLTSIENTTSDSRIRLVFKEPVEKNGQTITYNANVSFSYKLLCGQISASADIWQKMTDISSPEVIFTNLQSYSVFKVRVWASTSAGGGPVTETLSYTKHGVPTSTPRDVRIQEQLYESLIFTWKPPDCYHQNAPQDETKFQYKLWPVNSSTEAENAWIITSSPPLVKVPGPPEDLKVNSRNSTSLLMEWKAPDKPNGRITTYKVGCTPGDDRNIVVMAEVRTLWMLELQPKTQYSCYVKASTRKGFGKELQRTFKTLGAPREPEVQTTTEHSITIKLHRIPGDESFTYLVLVKKHMKVNRATHEELTDIVTAPTYNQSHTNKPYRTAKLEGKDLDKPFIVGDGLMYGGIYNGPLGKGNVYSVLYGALDKNGAIASDFSATNDPVKAVIPPTPANHWITPVIVVAVLLLVFLMIVIGFVSWKKRKEANEETVVREEKINECIYEDVKTTQNTSHTKSQEGEASSTTPGSTIPISQTTKVQKATKKTTGTSNEIEMKGMNIDRGCLEMMECIGTGCVADVWLAHFTGDPLMKADKSQVAVKMLRESVTRRQRRVFLDELRSVKAVPRHRNVIAFIGTCTKRDSVMIVMEFAPGGNLKGYLRDHRTHANTVLPLTSNNLLSFALDVASGMDHLTKFEMIHSNLAARKVYLGDNGICKISDFSKADQIKEHNVNLKKTLAPLPLRWMAIESIEKDEYTIMSNVWSFGVLLWEIITLAETPYQNLKDGDILSAIKSGYRLPKRPYCDHCLYKLMNSCWTVNPSERPTFLSLYQQLEGLLDGKAEYICIDEINEHVYQSLKK